MITSVENLERVRARWLGAGRDRKLFDQVIAVLDCATANSDVKNALRPPTYAIRSVGPAHSGPTDVAGIFAGGELMLKYKLEEVADDADVVILP